MFNYDYGTYPNGYFSMTLTGSVSVGTIWGTGTYTSDSALATAAVHSGVLSNNQAGTVYVQVTAGQSSYTGSTNNGVTSLSYGPWPSSYTFVCDPNAGCTISGTISGLTGTGLVLTDSNAGTTSTISPGATNFMLPTAINTGTSYTVTVQTQPTGQTCTVSNGSGTAPANVTSVLVTCTNNPTPPSPPNPIPTLSEWAQIMMMLAMIATAGFYGRRMKQR